MTNRELLDAARRGMENSYSPYSDFKVGAAVLVDDGTVYTGCNIEDASLGATICAERTAMVKAVSEGHRHFQKVAIVSSGNFFTYPCGICRQFMVEFMKDGVVVLEDKDEGIREFTLEELLPGGFTNDDLKTQK